MAADLLAAGYLGGAVCYSVVLLMPGEPRMPLVWAIVLAAFWPATLLLVHERRHEGGRR